MKDIVSERWWHFEELKTIILCPTFDVNLQLSFYHVKAILQRRAYAESK